MEVRESSNDDQMSGLDGQGHPEPMTAEGAANTLKFISDDHPCCAHALKDIILWLESLCPKCGAERVYYDGWNCPGERCNSKLESVAFVAAEGETRFTSKSEDEVRDFAEVAKCNGVKMIIKREDRWTVETILPDQP